MLLTPDRHTGADRQHYHDPYTISGARSILRRFRDEVIEMLDHMMQVRAEYDDGRTMLAQSPLRHRVYVAAAMKTMGLVEEHETKNGSCALTLTDRALRQMENMRRYL